MKSSNTSTVPGTSRCAEARSTVRVELYRSQSTCSSRSGPGSPAKNAGSVSSNQPACRRALDGTCGLAGLPGLGQATEAVEAVHGLSCAFGDERERAAEVHAAFGDQSR